MLNIYYLFVYTNIIYNLLFILIWYRHPFYNICMVFKYFVFNSPYAVFTIRSSVIDFSSIDNPFNKNRFADRR